MTVTDWSFLTVSMSVSSTVEPEMATAVTVILVASSVVTVKAELAAVIDESVSS